MTAHLWTPSPLCRTPVLNSAPPSTGAGAVRGALEDQIGAALSDARSSRAPTSSACRAVMPVVEFRGVAVPDSGCPSRTVGHAPACWARAPQCGRTAPRRELSRSPRPDISAISGGAAERCGKSDELVFLTNTCSSRLRLTAWIVESSGSGPLPLLAICALGCGQRRKNVRLGCFTGPTQNGRGRLVGW